MKWLVISSLSALSAFAGLNFFNGKNDRNSGAELFPNGRDSAMIAAMNSAKNSVLVKTDRFELCEIATVLANLPAKKIKVTVEIPYEAACRPRETALAKVLPETGVNIKIGMSPSEEYKGTLVVIDDETVLYSGSGLNYAPENASRPYLIGKLKR